MAFRKPAGLLVASGWCALAILINWIFNESDRRVPLGGVILALILAAPYLLVRIGIAPLVPAVVFCVAGAAGAVAALASFAVGARLYRAWMDAVAPIGWTFSALVLGLVYLLVITPIGWAIRLLGRDPMQRAFERQRTTYWTPRTPATDPSRYFRQF
jgi:hypothetical protein